ncbi:MAG: hypothetical protein J6V99_02305 [Neisseriaceae bacterium]|nr:hypothetical protein [Neisseriaceae bacterium]
MLCFILSRKWLALIDTLWIKVVCLRMRYINSFDTDSGNLKDFLHLSGCLLF